MTIHQTYVVHAIEQFEDELVRLSAGLADDEAGRSVEWLVITVRAIGNYLRRAWK